MTKLLKVILPPNFTPFISAWGALAVPFEYEGEFYMPLGWEAELTQRNIEYTEVEINLNENT